MPTMDMCDIPKPASQPIWCAHEPYWAAITPEVAASVETPAFNDRMSSSSFDADQCSDNSESEVESGWIVLSDTAHTTSAQISFIPYLRRFILGNPGRTVALPPKAGTYHCATQQRTSGTTRARIGSDGYIPRWQKGSTIRYIVCDESFKNSSLATIAAARAVEATSMWEGIGVKFEQVHRNRAATFQIMYLDLPDDHDPNVCAESFFPRAGTGTLFIYKFALEEANMDYLANILAHEVGHILGLRHEFAGDIICERPKKTMEQGSVLWGEKNAMSVMNYYSHPSLHTVQEQDLKELKSFYDFTGKSYAKLTIRDFKPSVVKFRRARSSHCL
ncbi:hypothetical protein GGS24DRAFT_483314 [Hypoxylon argillaceum]|nr:hypothetical protein GGS24DRAFT_483314 [Hypoxylon argillaceum]